MTMLLPEQFQTNTKSDPDNETNDNIGIISACSREGSKDFGASISMSNIQIESPAKRGGRRQLQEDDRMPSYPLFQSISFYSPLDSTMSPNYDLYNQSQFRKSVSFDNMFLVEIGDAINSDDEGDNDDYVNEGSDSCQSNACSPTDMMMNELGRKSLSSLKTAKTFTDTTCSRSSCTFAYYGDEDEVDENNNDELLADDQLVKLVSSDGSCLKSIRSVIFDDECNYQIYMIESYKDIPESCDLFLSVDELDQIKRSNESAAYHMIDQHEDDAKQTDLEEDDDDDDETVRGLEYVAEIGKWKRYEYIRDSTNAVILLQASYEMSKMMQASSDESQSDEEIAQEIAKTYQKETVQAVQEAYQRGLDDYVELFSFHEKKPKKLNIVTSTTHDEQQQEFDNESVVNNDSNVSTMTPTVDCSQITKPPPKKSSFLDDSSSGSDDSSNDDDDDDSESYEDLLQRMRLTSSPVKQLLFTTKTRNIGSHVAAPTLTDAPMRSSLSDASDDDSSCSSSESSDDDKYEARLVACTKPTKTGFDTIQKTSTATTTDCNDSFSSCDDDDDDDDDDQSSTSSESKSYACTTIAQASVQCLEGAKTAHGTKNAIPMRPIRKSCFKRVLCTCTGTTSSDQPQVPKKSVVFDEPIVSCTEFVSLIKDIPKDIYSEIWWTHEEMLQLRQECEGLLYMIDQNMSYDETAESARGLEIRTEEGEWKFYEHKRDAWNAVLGLQDDYMYKNKCCSTSKNLHELISQAYIEEGLARKTREEALQRAIDDYEAIQDYLSEI